MFRGVLSLVCVLSFLPQAAQAGTPRATEKQLDEKTRPLDEYLKDIRKNYVAVDSLILKRGKGDTPQLVARFTVERLKATNALDKAVYSYLLARARYWQGFHQFKATHDRNVFAALRPVLTHEYLSAFRHVRTAGEAPSAAPVRKRIIGAFVSALSTNIWGASLTPAEKTRVINEFLVVVEEFPDAEALLPADTLTFRMYQNLGREPLAVKKFPKDLPEDYDELMGLVEKYHRHVPLTMLLPALAALEKQHDARRKKDPDALAKMAAVYASGGRVGDSYRLLSRAAQLRSMYYLPLYMLSLQHGKELQQDNPRQFLEPYLAGAKAPRKYTRAKAYKRTAAALLKAKRFKECLYVIGRYEGEGAGTHVFETSVRLAYTKARCLEETGEKAKATAEYRRLIAITEGKSGVDVHRRNAERRLKKLVKHDV